MTLATPSQLLTLALLLAPPPATRPAEEIPIDPEQEARLLKEVGPNFKIRRTPHFLVACDADAVLLNDFVSRLESTYRGVYQFCRLNRIDASRPEHRLEVILFNERKSYDRYCERVGFRSAGTFGVYLVKANRSLFFNAATDPDIEQLQRTITSAQNNIQNLEGLVRSMNKETSRIEIQYADGRRRIFTRAEAEKELESTRQRLRALDGQRVGYTERINRTAIQHEIAHQVLYNAGVHTRGPANPRWLVEGMACLFETPPDTTGSGIHAINQLRLRDFRLALAGDTNRQRLTSRDFADAIEAGRLPEPRKLLGNPSLFDARGETGGNVYALSWSLAMYLQRNHTERFASYLKEIAQRAPDREVSPEDEIALFEKHFGAMDRTFQNRWADFITRLPYRSTGAF